MSAVDRPAFYITTAIAYPNGAPHIGHAYEYISTDALVGMPDMRRTVRVRDGRGDIEGGAVDCAHGVSITSWGPV